MEFIKKHLLSERMKCDVCGKYISVRDVRENKAQWIMTLPDSELTVETWKGLCREHYNKPREENMYELNTKYKVYDKVWMMKNNKPTKFTVFAVTTEMSWYRDGVNIKYTIIDESGLQVGHGVKESYRITKDETDEDFFGTKEELIESL